MPAVDFSVIIPAMVIKKAIIPVAGLGTRFLPATKAQPKEMLAVVDKPVIQYLVEEAVASGISEIIFVTGRSKRAIEDHFDYAPELEMKLLSKKKREAFAAVRAISEMAKFAYVRQKEPRGDGDAILCAEHLIGDEPVAVLFGDDIVDSATPCLRQLIKVFDKYGGTVVALEEVPKNEVSRYGIIDGIRIEEGVYEIKKFVEKPSLNDAPSRLAAVGKYVLTPETIAELRRIKKPKNEEVRLADALASACGKMPVYGLRFQGVRYDCGSKLGFLKATVDFALKHKEVSGDFMKFLKKRVKKS